MENASKSKALIVTSTREGPLGKMDLFLMARGGGKTTLHAEYVERIMQAYPDMVVGGKTYDFKNMNDSLAGDRHQPLVIDDMYPVDRFMAGHDVALNESEQQMVYRLVSEEFRQQMGSYLDMPIRPARTYADFRPLKGQKRAKALAKRAKDKANRKRSRK